MSKLDRISAERRTFVGSALTSMGLFSFLSACGGSGAAEQEASESSLARSRSRSPSRSPSRPLPSPPPPVVPGADRTSQTYLFQNSPQPYQSVIGGGPFNPAYRGPNHRYVDAFGGWKWTNQGGDWIDANGIAQGPTPYVSFTDPAGTVGTYTTHSSIDVTALVQRSQVLAKWCAFYVYASSFRSICTNWHPTHPVPLISVTYSDATTATLTCRIVARMNRSSESVLSLDEEAPIDPVVVEFERPSKTVASATLRITLRRYFNEPQAAIHINPCNPPLNTDPVTNAGGLASSAGNLDENITNVPGVIGAQRYTDGTSLGDFAVLDNGGNANVGSEDYYDPALWGGAPNLTKLPHAFAGTPAAGKWVNVNLTTLSKVDSTYSGQGFVPLAPGLGALKLVMPNDSVPIGEEVRNSGTAVNMSYLFMPPDEMGLLSEIFTRQYMFLGTPHTRTPADRREVRRFDNPTWSDMGGKMGISPSHNNTYGGFSGSSGGGRGWQMRWSWADCETNVGGPDEAGVMPGWHLWDFGANQPPGYNYASEIAADNNWGQRNGLGAVMYAGRWYEVETQVKLNTVNPADNSYLADGILRTWIDGRLVFERTGMVFRTLPAYNPGYISGRMRPIRELGVGWLLWNWYNGGLTASTVERTIFTTGLVWARQRIGAMRGAATS